MLCGLLLSSRTYTLMARVKGAALQGGRSFVVVPEVASTLHKDLTPCMPCAAAATSTAAVPHVFDPHG